MANRTKLFPRVLDFVYAFAPSPDGRRLATIERNLKDRPRKYWIRIHDLDKNKVVREWEHPERGYWMRWKPDALIVNNDKTAFIYRPNSGKLVRRHSINGREFALSLDKLAHS